MKEILEGTGHRQLTAKTPGAILGYLAGRALNEKGREQKAGCMCVIARDAQEARDLARQLSEACGRRFVRQGRTGICWFPPLSPDPYADSGQDPEWLWAHLAAAFRLASSQAPALVVTSPELFASTTLSPEHLLTSTVRVKVGDDVDRDGLAEQLSRIGYMRERLVTEPGTLALRGGVMDIFPPQLQQPVRVDLFGDTVDRINLFHQETQRTSASLKSVCFPPVTPFMFSEGDAARVEARIRDLAEDREVPSLKLAAHLEGLSSGLKPPGGMGYLPAFVGALEPASRFIPPDTRFIHLGMESLEGGFERHLARIQQGFSDACAHGRIAAEPASFVVDTSMGTVLEPFEDRLEISHLVLGHPEALPQTLHTEPVGFLQTLLQKREDPEHPFLPVIKELQAWEREGLAVHILAGHDAQLRRLKKLITNHIALGTKSGGWLYGRHRAGIYLWRGRISEGFVARELAVVYVDEADIFGARSRLPSASPLPAEHLIRSFRELNRGDLVVHRDHGIGRFQGLRRMTAGGVDGDFLELHYRDGAKLFLPIMRIGVLQRYMSSGREGYEPPLDRLGGIRWKNARRKARQAAEEIAGQLLELHADRLATTVEPVSPPDALFAQFEATFPYAETPDQDRAIREVLEDMQKTRPMDRVVCGDVGFGKTEVALRAAFKAVEDSRQVVVLVPTTILAEQHYLTMKERLRDFPVTVAQLSRFVPRSEQTKVLAGLRSGKVDIVVGTHRLLQPDISFRNLGLVVIDEEHRFGVKNKERLKRLRADVDVLTLTATPIPRTLHMSLMGIRDLSIIATAPAGRQVVETQILSRGDSWVRAGIERELARGGQVYFVTPRIKGIELLLKELQALAPRACMAVAHGRMPARELEKVMRAFIRGEVDVLVSTNIIESGIDVPNANTLFVDRAERFGLAQLYQLRGRIGRSSRKAYCTFLVPEVRAMTQEAQRRLGVLQRINKLGSGFAMAMEDLELRGAGNLLGAHQHGHVDAVGYQTFLDLLHDAVAERKGVDAAHRGVRTDVQIDSRGFLPDDYLPDDHDRLVLYRRLAAAPSLEALSALVEEVEDRYGRLPEEANSLVRMSRVRILAAAQGFSTVVCSKVKLKLGFGPGITLEPEVITEFLTRPGQRWTLSPDMILERKVQGAERLDLVETVSAALRETRTITQGTPG